MWRVSVSTRQDLSVPVARILERPEPLQMRLIAEALPTLPRRALDLRPMVVWFKNLFGSYARGKISEDSDLDVLIVAGDEVENTRRESVRLRGALKEIEMPIDIVVVRESTFQKLSDTPGLIYEEARRTGLLVYESKSWPSGRLSAFMARARQERFAHNTDLPLRQWGPCAICLIALFGQSPFFLR
jgi:predicted nucleotidyltransferase